MVILVEGVPLNQVPTSTEEFYQKFPSVVEKGSSFAHQETIAVGKEFALYVAQGEFGVVPSNDSKIKYVGSDDATTCHVVILKHSSGTVCVAHLDGSKNEEASINAMVAKIARIEGSADMLDLHVVGGYVPEEGSREAVKNESEHLSLKILGIFMNLKGQFNLALWCTCCLNTTLGSDGGPRPKAYGAAVNLSSGMVFPAVFQSHDPEKPMRSAARWVSNSGKLCDLYDHESGTISIHPFHYSCVQHFAFYLSLPDEVILNNYSTSPKVEPPSFCQDMREIFKVFVSHPKPDVTLFPDNKPKCYTLDDDGLWQLVKK